MKKNLFSLIVILTLILNINSVSAYDSGVVGDSGANPWTGQLQEGQGSIQNFNESPVIRITAVDKDGKKISGSISMDYYSIETPTTGKIYYKGYKFGTDGGHSKKQDDFFGLSTSDNYEIVLQKIKTALDHKSKEEIINFLKSLKLTETDINKRISEKNIFLIIEPVFMINDGVQNVSGTSSEIVKYLYDLEASGRHLYNIHYAGTLELMGKSLLMMQDGINLIISRGFSNSKITIPADKSQINSWTQELANKIQSSSSGYGLVMYYVGDLIPCNPGECDGNPGDYTYVCKSSQQICDNNTDLNINGLSSSYSGDGSTTTGANCVYNNPKYKFGQTNSYCTAKITSSTSSVLNKVSQVNVGRFVGVNSTPTLTISWQCYSESESERNSIKQYLSAYKMPDIKYNFFSNSYVYKNDSVTILYNSETNKGNTPYGSTYYPLTIVTRYNYKYETTYLNKWVDKETGKGSGNSSTKPIQEHEYSVNPNDINFEVPLDEKIIGTNTITVTFDLLTSINDASSYIKKYGQNNGTLTKSISVTKYKTDKNGKTSSYLDTETIEFKNSDSLYGKDNFICPSTVIVNSNPNVPTNLVYRPIDLSNPFPGLSGAGRDSGSNWTISNIQTYITDRQDVYNKVPLYTITLTPDSIKEIRKYNKSNNYNDESTLSCDEEGHHCLSTFLREEKFSNIVDQNKSVCYNINSTIVFDSCADYLNRK